MENKALKGSEKIHCGRKVYILILYLLLADGLFFESFCQKYQRIKAGFGLYR